jgi:hypothetical protein
VKPFDILKVKTAMAGSVCYVTGYVIHILVMSGILKIAYSSYLQLGALICSFLDLAVCDSLIDIPGSLPI